MPLLTDEERVGTTLNDRYRLTSIVGRGGMGTVFRGMHTRTQRLVAVKFLHPEFARDNEAVGRFVREAQASAALRHPNVVDILDMDWDQGGFYLVMEFLEGESLDARLARSAPLSEQETLEVVLPVLDALGHAHTLDIVHRDLKPDNILLSIDATGALVPKLLDFGVAKLLSSSQTQQPTRNGALIGTPTYMSPEQVAGTEFVDARTDIWAMGVLVFECLSGAPPFASDNPMTLCMRLLSEPVPSLRSRRTGPVSDRVIEAVECALRKDPQERLATMWEFASALTGETYRPRPGSQPPRPAAKRWAPPTDLGWVQAEATRLASVFPAVSPANGTGSGAGPAGASGAEARSCMGGSEPSAGGSVQPRSADAHSGRSSGADAINVIDVVDADRAAEQQAVALGSVGSVGLDSVAPRRRRTPARRVPARKAAAAAAVAKRAHEVSTSTGDELPGQPNAMDSVPPHGGHLGRVGQRGHVGSTAGRLAGENQLGAPLTRDSRDSLVAASDRPPFATLGGAFGTIAGHLRPRSMIVAAVVLAAGLGYRWVSGQAPQPVADPVTSVPPAASSAGPAAGVPNTARIARPAHLNLNESEGDVPARSASKVLAAARADKEQAEKRLEKVDEKEAVGAAATGSSANPSAVTALKDSVAGSTKAQPGHDAAVGGGSVNGAQPGPAAARAAQRRRAPALLTDF